MDKNKLDEMAAQTLIGLVIVFVLTIVGVVLAVALSHPGTTRKVLILFGVVLGVLVGCWMVGWTATEGLSKLRDRYSEWQE